MSCAPIVNVHARQANVSIKGGGAKRIVLSRDTVAKIIENRPQAVVLDRSTPVRQVDRPTVVHAGTPGLQGPPGTGGAGYVHTQASPAATWTINHNLGFRPSVELIDAGGAEFDGEIVHTSLNQTVVYLDEATAGLARLN